MSVSKTSYYHVIASILKEMLKTFTGLSNRTEKVEVIQKAHEEKMKDHDSQMEIIVRQHLELIRNVKGITQVQGDIAKQILNQHEEMEQLLKALGLKKDLSYYSYNIMEQEGH